MKTYRCAIVGCGGRAEMHALAYRHVTRGKLVACCDRNAERREAFAARHGLTGYADASEMLRQEQPDLVHLVTAPSTRVELMTLVHEAEVPACIVEKPIATQVRDWRALVQLEQASGTKFGVGAQFRYHPDLAHCRAALASGRLGDLRFLDCSAGGTICDQGVHVLDWAMSLNRDVPVTRVFGTASGAANLDHPMHPSPDNTIAQLLFANGVVGMWNLGTSAPRVVDRPVYYAHCRVAAYAARGHTLYEEFGRWEVAGPGGEECGHVDDRGWAEGNHLAQAALTNGMFDWLEGGGPVGTNLRRSLEQWNVILALYAATVRREPIAVPFDPPDDLWEQLGAALREGRGEETA